MRGRLSLPLFPPPRVNIWWNQTVVAKFQDRRHFLPADIQRLVDQHWKSRAPIQVSRLADEIRQDEVFLFHCDSLADKEALLHLGNAAMLGALMVINDPVLTKDPKYWRFNDVSIWVHFEGVPAPQRNSDVALLLADLIGEVIELGFQGGREIHNLHFRVKVRLNLLVPLKSGAYLDTANGRKWVFFRYENVFRFCKACGEVGHSLATCNRTSVAQFERVHFSLLHLEDTGHDMLQDELRPYYTNKIRAFPYIPKFLTSSLDLGGPGGPAFIPSNIYGYGYGPSDEDFSEPASSTSDDSDSSDDNGNNHPSHRPDTTRTPQSFAVSILSSVLGPLLITLLLQVTTLLRQHQHHRQCLLLLIHHLHSSLPPLILLPHFSHGLVKPHLKMGSCLVKPCVVLPDRKSVV